MRNHGVSRIHRPSTDHRSAFAKRSAAVLLAAKLDRISRSVLDTASLMEQARRDGWELATCDLAIDTSTPAGEATASTMAVFSQLERRLISAQSRSAGGQESSRRTAEYGWGVLRRCRPRSSGESSARGRAANRCARSRRGLTGIACRPPKAERNGTLQQSRPCSKVSTRSAWRRPSRRDNRRGLQSLG